MTFHWVISCAYGKTSYNSLYTQRFFFSLSFSLHLFPADYAWYIVLYTYYYAWYISIIMFSCRAYWSVASDLTQQLVILCVNVTYLTILCFIDYIC